VLGRGTCVLDVVPQGPGLVFIFQIYTVSQKRDLYTFAHNFGRCWRIFEIFPLLNSSRNLQQTDCYIAHHTLDVLLHYLVKWQLLQTAIFISKQCP